MAITVDTRGKQCPMPLIMFKKALKDNPDEHAFLILTDNDTACSNLLDFIEQNGFDAARHEEDGYIKIEVNAGVHHKSSLMFESKGNAELIGPQIIAVQLRSNVMGHGNDELGAKLMGAFLGTLKELDRLPTHIVCYNGGVQLAADNSPVLDKLKELEELGVSIIVCGTCVSFYGLDERIAVGKISNMYVIADILSKAMTTVTP